MSHQRSTPSRDAAPTRKTGGRNGVSIGTADKANREVPTFLFLGSSGSETRHHGVDERQSTTGPRRGLPRPPAGRRYRGRRCRDRRRYHGHRLGGRRPDNHPIQLSRPIIQSTSERRGGNTVSRTRCGGSLHRRPNTSHVTRNSTQVVCQPMFTSVRPGPVGRSRRYFWKPTSEERSVSAGQVAGDSRRDALANAPVRCSGVTEGRVDRQRRQHALDLLAAPSPPWTRQRGGKRTMREARTARERYGRGGRHKERGGTPPPTTIAILESIQKASLRDRHAFIK